MAGNIAVDQFKAQLRDGGSRANLFKVLLTFPDFLLPTLGSSVVEKASFMCKTAQLPQSSVGSFTVPYRGREFKLPGERTFDPWTVTIYNTNDFDVRDAFERWSQGMVGHALNTGILDPAKYQVDLTVQHLKREQTERGRARKEDRLSDISKEVKIVGAFPEVVGPIDLSYDTTGEIETFDVTFQYQYWTSNTTDAGSLVQPRFTGGSVGSF